MLAALLGWLMGLMGRGDRRLVSRKHDRGVDYVSFADLAMFDWDWPDVGHPTAECVTVSSVEEVLTRLRAFCLNHPDTCFRVYRTPGGIRAFCVSHRMRAADGARLQRELGCDPLYTAYTVEKGRFWARTSPKPERTTRSGLNHDFVAEALCDVGTGPIDCHQMRLIAIHDRLVDRGRRRSAQMNARLGAAKAAADAATSAATASASWATRAQDERLAELRQLLVAASVDRRLDGIVLDWVLELGDEGEDALEILLAEARVEEQEDRCERSYRRRKRQGYANQKLYTKTDAFDLWAVVYRLKAKVQGLRSDKDDAQDIPF